MIRYVFSFTVISEQLNFTVLDLKIDEQAVDLIKRSKSRVPCPEKVPVLIPRDGNCLFSCASVALCGNFALATELRFRTCVEMVTQVPFYDNKDRHPELVKLVGDYQKSCIDCCQLSK